MDSNGFFGSANFTFTGEAESGVENLSNSDLRTALITRGIDSNFLGDLSSQSDERTDLTARFGWRNDNMQAYIFGSNLLDDDGVTSRSLGRVGRNDGAVDLDDSPSFVLQQPRVIGVGVEFNL